MVTPAQRPSISASRLWATLEHYAQFGATPDGGVTRPIFSPADASARAQLVAHGRALGLEVAVDAAANVILRRQGATPGLPAIVIGSHLDSVPAGGRFDGALGVHCALEVLRTLHDHAIATRHPVALISFSGEEATAYGTSTFGSRAVSGRLPDVAENLLPDGRTVRRALRDCGGDWERLGTAREALGPVACFLEAHIEQGKRLELSGRPLAAVSGVTGICRQRITFRGMAGHAGTTAMAERHDALRAAARFVLDVAEKPREIAARDAEATATVGFLQVSPNSPNVIPGEVAAVTDLRSADHASLATMARSAAAAAQQAAYDEGVEVEISTILDQAPIAFDGRVRALIGAVVAGLGGEERELSSQAGHDAVHMQSCAPSGMIFVRCRGGVSHHAAEYAAPEDAALAAQALLHSVLAADLWPAPPAT